MLPELDDFLPSPAAAQASQYAKYQHVRERMPEILLVCLAVVADRADEASDPLAQLRWPLCHRENVSCCLW